MADEKVKVRVRCKPGIGVAGERLWAEPVDAHDGGGTYVLLNNGYSVPVVVGDLVRAELDGDGTLQVTELVQLAPVVVSSFELWCDNETGCAMGDRWRECGATWSEGAGGFMTTVWGPGVDARRVLEVVAPDVAAGRGHLRWVAGPDRRARELPESVELELDREDEFPPVETSYWAADDPYWHEQGLHTPDFLAYIQWLAASDELIATALEVGDHEKVREMVAFINDGPVW